MILSPDWGNGSTWTCSRCTIDDPWATGATHSFRVWSALSLHGCARLHRWWWCSTCRATHHTQSWVLQLSKIDWLFDAKDAWFMKKSQHIWHEAGTMQPMHPPASSATLSMALAFQLQWIQQHKLCASMSGPCVIVLSLCNLNFTCRTEHSTRWIWPWGLHRRSLRAVERTDVCAWSLV